MFRYVSFLFKTKLNNNKMKVNKNNYSIIKIYRNLKKKQLFHFVSKKLTIVGYWFYLFEIQLHLYKLNMNTPKQNGMSSLPERHQYILARLKKEGKVNVLDLCKDLNVSSVTIRKDLKLLEDKSLLYRTH